MASLFSALNSTVGRKYLMGATGLGMVGFAATHLTGNLQLLIPDGGRAFNEYTLLLHNLGGLLYVLEVGLLVMFGLHIWLAFVVTADNKHARPRDYEVKADAGGPSKKSKASLNMIMSGFILLCFLVLHILSFRFGPPWTVSEARTPQLLEMAMSHPDAADMAGIVVTRFKAPLYALFYVFSMAMLGAHLRHGFWSAFQSLGLLAPRFEKPILGAGYVLAAALAIGFLFLPLWVLIDPMGMYAELAR
jgi:succinate dehydrogenase / fumarate reductase cytochrome b subunit